MPVAIPPLVGRADEIAHLHGLLRCAAAGAGGLAVITGEPGVGKTRLVEAGTTAASAFLLADRLLEVVGGCAPPVPCCWPWRTCSGATRRRWRGCAP